MTRTDLAVLATVALTLATAWSLGYEPHNARADAPQQDPDAAHIEAFVRGCAAADYRATGKMQAGVYSLSCDPTLGLGPSVQRRVRK